MMYYKEYIEKGIQAVREKYKGEIMVLSSYDLIVLRRLNNEEPFSEGFDKQWLEEAWKIRKCKLYSATFDYLLEKSLSVRNCNVFFHRCLKDEKFTEKFEESRTTSVLEMKEKKKEKPPSTKK